MGEEEPAVAAGDEASAGGACSRTEGGGCSREGEEPPTAAVGEVAGEERRSDGIREAGGGALVG